MARGAIFKEQFTEAYNDKSGFDKVKLKQIIKSGFGESNELDFKEQMISEEKIAKIILSMANSGGGTIIFGVDDNGKPVGVQDKIKDPTDYERKLDALLPHTLLYYPQQLLFSDDNFYKEFTGKVFLIIQVPKQYRYVPFLAKKESVKLKTNEVYIRKNTSTVTANNEDLEKMIQLRLLEQYDDLSSLSLDEHLNQLKSLYSKLSKTIEEDTEENFVLFHSEHGSRFGLLPLAALEDNPNYPQESYDEFLSKIITKKKKKIEVLLEVSSIDQS